MKDCSLYLIYFKEFRPYFSLPLSTAQQMEILGKSCEASRTVDSTPISRPSQRVAPAPPMSFNGRPSSAGFPSLRSRSYNVRTIMHDVRTSIRISPVTESRCVRKGRDELPPRDLSTVLALVRHRLRNDATRVTKKTASHADIIESDYENDSENEENYEEAQEDDEGNHIEESRWRRIYGGRRSGWNETLVHSKQDNCSERDESSMKEARQLLTKAYLNVQGKLSLPLMRTKKEQNTEMAKIGEGYEESEPKTEPHAEEVTCTNTCPITKWVRDLHSATEAATSDALRGIGEAARGPGCHSENEARPFQLLASPSKHLVDSSSSPSHKKESSPSSALSPRYNTLSPQSSSENFIMKEKSSNYQSNLKGEGRYECAPPLIPSKTQVFKDPIFADAHSLIRTWQKVTAEANEIERRSGARRGCAPQCPGVGAVRRRKDTFRKDFSKGNRRGEGRKGLGCNIEGKKVKRKVSVASVDPRLVMEERHREIRERREARKRRREAAEERANVNALRSEGLSSAIANRREEPKGHRSEQSASSKELFSSSAPTSTSANRVSLRS